MQNTVLNSAQTSLHMQMQDNRPAGFSNAAGASGRIV
jgi:hypothetical protein